MKPTVLLRNAASACFVELRQIAVRDPHCPAIHVIERTDDVQQRAFSAARRPDDGHAFPRLNIKCQVAQDIYFIAAIRCAVTFLQILNFDEHGSRS